MTSRAEREVTFFPARRAPLVLCVGAQPSGDDYALELSLAFFGSREAVNPFRRPPVAEDDL